VKLEPVITPDGSEARPDEIIHVTVWRDAYDDGMHEVDIYPENMMWEFIMRATPRWIMDYIHSKRIDLVHFYGGGRDDKTYRRSRRMRINKNDVRNTVLPGRASQEPVLQKGGAG